VRALLAPLAALAALVSAAQAPAPPEPTEAAPPAAEPTLLPGWWETTNTVDFGTGQTTVERRCVRAADIDRFFSGPSNRHYTCEYPSRVVGGGRAAFEGKCTDKRGRSVGVWATGTYTPESFELHAQIQASLLGLPVTATGVSRGRRLSAECPEEK
jgi:hypothetical protein